MKILLMLMLAFPLWLPLVAFGVSESSKGGVIVDRVVRVIDGDTIVVDVNAWPELFGKAVKVRLRGVDTPELRGKCPKEKALAYKAKEFVYNKVGSEVRVILTNLSRGTFFRVVADVEVGGVDLGSALIRAGLAREYIYSEGRKSWCR